ncbi:hypothetical protein F2Q69_00006624 [Brassica cretica]|uniref:Uncharacterized protein n=1 Tax=Brassica cretica TaxID=69181 RepID=A0A8S9NTC6_BRACR|nr:hypothetical protein F2Q69_00006624 [Brassica cretica]
MHGFVTSWSSYIIQRSGLTGQHMATRSVNGPVAVWRPELTFDRSPYGDRFVHSTGRHMATGLDARTVAIWRPVRLLDWPPYGDRFGRSRWSEGWYSRGS